MSSGGEVLAAGGEFGTTVSLEFCLAASEIAGCTDPTAANYNPAATVDDGSCVAAVPGCTTPAACNYNPAANVEDGSCEFPVQYYTCDEDCISDDDGDGVCTSWRWPAAKTTRLATTTKRPRISRVLYPDEGYNCDGSPLP